jgi:hypothetical protein
LGPVRRAGHQHDEEHGYKSIHKVPSTRLFVCDARTEGEVTRKS